MAKHSNKVEDAAFEKRFVKVDGPFKEKYRKESGDSLWKDARKAGGQDQTYGQPEQDCM
jgi:hypothetical protein